MSSPDIAQLLLDQKAAEARSAIAEAEQKEAEAKKLTALAEYAVASAEDQARRDAAKAEAETRKAVAEAEAAAVKAYLPAAATLKPLEGDVTTDAASGILAETAAYALFEAAAEALAEKVDGRLNGARVLVVTDRQLAGSDWAYHATKQGIKQLTDELGGLLTKLGESVTASVPAQPSTDTAEEDMVAGVAPLALVSALPAIVGAAADIAGYFQSNYSITGRAFDAKVEPLVAAMAGAIASGTTTSVVDGFHRLPDSSLMRDYDRMLGQKWKVTGARIGQEQHQLAALVPAVERAKADLARDQAAVTEAQKADPSGPARTDAEATLELSRERLLAAEAALAANQSLIAIAIAAEVRVEGFVTTVITAPSAGGLPPLGQAVLREALHDGQPAISHVLHVAVSSSGGETQIRRRRFFAPTVRYVGACTISVLLAAIDGTVVHAQSQALFGQLTYLMKDGELGTLKRVTISG